MVSKVGCGENVPLTRAATDILFVGRNENEMEVAVSGPDYRIDREDPHWLVRAVRSVKEGTNEDKPYNKLIAVAELRNLIPENRPSDSCVQKILGILWQSVDEEKVCPLDLQSKLESEDPLQILEAEKYIANLRAKVEAIV